MDGLNLKSNAVQQSVYISGFIILHGMDMWGRFIYAAAGVQVQAQYVVNSMQIVEPVDTSVAPQTQHSKYAISYKLLSLLNLSTRKSLNMFVLSCHQ